MSDETKVSDEIVSANEKAPTTLESAATEPAPAVEASPEASHDLPPVLNPERIELTPEAMARLDAMLEGESEAIARDPTPKEERAEYVVLHSSAPAAIPDGSTVRLDAQEKADAEGAGFTFCTREEFEEKIALAETAAVPSEVDAEAGAEAPEAAPPAPAEPTRSYRVLGVPEGIEGVTRLSIVSLTFEQLAAAVSRGFLLSEVQPPCPTCEGHGHVSPALGLPGDGTCPTCRGSGTTTPVPSPQDLAAAVEHMETDTAEEAAAETSEEDDPDLASWISDSQGGTLP